MKQKTIRFGSYWLKAYKCCGELRIIGGLNKHKKIPERETTNMLVSSRDQLHDMVTFGVTVAHMAQELLNECKKR